jgi:hypothetical protein
MTPDTPRITDDEFRQFVMRTLMEHDSRMARMDQQYEKLVEIQLEHASRQDEHERIMDTMRATLEAIKDLLRERRN